MSVPQKTGDAVMMSRMQNLFNRLAGLAAYENERVSRAHAIFLRDEFRLAELEKPACWRRRNKVTTRRGSRHP